MPSLVGDGNFALTQTADGVRAEKSFADGLRLVKEFHVQFKLSGERGACGWKTLPDQPLALPAQEWVVGTATPMGADDNGMYLGAMWYNGTNTPQDRRSSFSRARRLCLHPPRAENGISSGHGQCRLGGGAQPVFHADRDAETAGAANHRAAGRLAVVSNVEQIPNTPPPWASRRRSFIRRRR